MREARGWGGRGPGLGVQRELAGTSSGGPGKTSRSLVRTEAGGRPRQLLALSVPQFLAMVFQDLLTNKDDYLRASRALLREIIKQTKHEINFQAFCLGLMQERKEPQYLDMEFKVGGPQARAGCLVLGSRPAVSPALSGVHLAVIGAPCARWPIPEAAGAASCEVQGGTGRVPPGEPVTSGLGQPGRRRWCTEGRRFWGVWGQREVPLESRTWGQGWRVLSAMWAGRQTAHGVVLFSGGRASSSSVG